MFKGDLMNIKDFVINLMFYIFSFFVSYLIISVSVIFGAVICFGSFIGFIVFIAGLIKNSPY
jgi:hypothetical protein